MLPTIQNKPPKAGYKMKTNAKCQPLKLEDATSYCNTEALQYFGPATKDVQSSQERCQTVDRVMVRITQVPESPRSLSISVDLKSPTEWCAPLDD
jgi:hypothetical protein